MHETAAEREMRLARQITINSCYGTLGVEEWFGVSELVINQNPCVEIMIDYSNQRCTLGIKPLVKFTEFKFKF